MGLFDMFGKKDVSDELTKKVPYALKIAFHPFRLSANRNDSVTMRIQLTNISKEPLLTSVIVKIPKKLGLDQTGLSQVREIRLGELPPGEEKTLTVEIFSSTKTDSAEYPIEVTAISHYRNYAYVLNSERKRGSLRVV